MVLPQGVPVAALTSFGSVIVFPECVQGRSWGSGMGPEKGPTQPTPGFHGFRGPGILPWEGLRDDGFWENCGGFGENMVDFGGVKRIWRKPWWIWGNGVNLGGKEGFGEKQMHLGKS